MIKADGMEKCPRCGSKRVARIVYGLPDFNEELDRKLNNEEIYLGGCLLSGINPRYHCYECGENVGRPPALISKDHIEDYRKIVTSVRFRDEGCPGGNTQIQFRKEEDRILLEISTGQGQSETPFRRAMTNAEWKELLDRLYFELYLHEWNAFFVDFDVPDGPWWELEIGLTKDRVQKYNGNNAFPPYWTELMETLRSFFKEAGIDTDNSAGDRAEQRVDWDQLTREQKKHQLYLKQKKLLDLFLHKGAISQAQHDKSLHDLKEKMNEPD